MVPSGLKSGKRSVGSRPASAGRPGELYYKVPSKSMGKRELLLVVAFVIAGVVVYQVTAPPPAPGERSFSVRQLLDNMRRGVQGNRASAESTSTSRHPVDPAVAEIRVSSRMGDLTIIGEDRTDIEAEIHVRSNGFDQAEAQRLAEETTLQVDSAGGRLVASVSYPRAGRQQTLRLRLRVPARLRVVLEASGSPLSVTGVAGLDLASSRGEARIRSIAGNVTGTHHGGELRVADSGSVTLTTMGTDVRLERVAGETTLNIRGGELNASELGGPIAIDSQGADLALDKIHQATGVLRITSVSGSVTVKGLQTQARLDVRNADVDIVVDRAFPLAIASEGGGSIEITPAAGGYQLDALTTGGDITLPEGTLQTTSEGEEHRAAGAVHGGGPTLTIRSARADIIVRQR